ncbi:MAG: HypC/HybG/HupF family hydrogenase formation chaperone [Parcubacteria group bacterium]|nr:HypC/HybG/HupF family hydrogenase formation chaperone [Parcubacteria group bacterium]
MCFAIPVQVKKLLPDEQAEVEQNDKTLVVSLKLVPKAKRGDWLLTQANLATEKISAAEAKEVLDYFNKAK